MCAREWGELTLARGAVGVAGEGRTAANRARRRAAGAGGVEDATVGTELPRLDSLLQEGEEDTAEPPAAISCFGAAGIDGETRENGGGAESASGARWGRSRSGKRGEQVEQVE